MSTIKEIKNLKSKLTLVEMGELNKNIQLFNDRVFTCFKFKCLHFFIKVFETVVNGLFPFVLITSPFLVSYLIYLDLNKHIPIDDPVLMWVKGFVIPLLCFISYNLQAYA